MDLSHGPFLCLRWPDGADRPRTEDQIDRRIGKGNRLRVGMQEGEVGGVGVALLGFGEHALGDVKRDVGCRLGRDGLRVVP